MGRDNLPRLGFDVLVEPAYPYGTNEQDLFSWSRPIRLVLTIPYATSVGSLSAAHVCVRPHMPVASVSPRAQRAHVRTLLPVRGVKPREYGSDTPVTTRHMITAKIYSTR